MERTNPQIAMLSAAYAFHNQVTTTPGVLDIFPQLHKKRCATIPF